jgi:hypothetical protein
MALLPDSGLYTYDAGADFNYFHGTRSHNTVVVDGLDQVEGAAVARAHGRRGSAYWATGTSDLVPGVDHRRSVILLQRGLVVVVDSLASSAAHAYVQTWHLFPNASLQLLGKNVVAKSADGVPRLAVSQADWSGLTLPTAFGVVSPLQGWYSVAYGSKNPNWALEYSRQASSARFVTLLASGGYAAQQPWVRQAWVTGQNRRRIWVSVGSTAYTLTLIAQGEAGEDLQVQTGLVGL